MRTKEQNAQFLVKIQTSNVIQSLALGRRSNDAFSKLFLWPASGIDAAGLIVANGATVYVGKDGDGPRVTPDALEPGDAPYSIILPDDAQMQLDDVLIQGTAGDGFFVSYTPVNPK